MALSSATPLPGALASVTRPAAQARIRPGHAEHAVGAEELGIDVGVVGAAVDDVHRRGPPRGAHEHLVAADEQVGGLDQLDAHRARQEAVLEVGRVERPRREHDDGRVVRVHRARPSAASRPAGSGSRRRGERRSAPSPIGNTRLVTRRFSITYDTPEGVRRLSSSTRSTPSGLRMRSMPAMWMRTPPGRPQAAQLRQVVLRARDQLGGITRAASTFCSP